jgi:hypothetical protein
MAISPSRIWVSGQSAWGALGFSTTRALAITGSAPELGALMMVNG